MGAYDSWTFVYEGRKFVAELHHDGDMGAPWDEHDGHGVVSDWTRRDKMPGEMLLHSDGRFLRRYYDFAGAMRLAKRDGWGIGPEALAALTAKLGRAPKPGEVRVAAVMADFEHLRRWCNDLWHWCSVVVRLADGDSTDTESVGGIESDVGDYLRETAEELASAVLAREAASEAVLNRALLAVAQAAAGIKEDA